MPPWVLRVPRQPAPPPSPSSDPPVSPAATHEELPVVAAAEPVAEPSRAPVEKKPAKPRAAKPSPAKPTPAKPTLPKKPREYDQIDGGAF